MGLPQILLHEAYILNTWWLWRKLNCNLESWRTENHNFQKILCSPPNGCPHSLELEAGQLASNFDVWISHSRIWLKCRFWFSWLGGVCRTVPRDAKAAQMEAHTWGGRCQTKYKMKPQRTQHINCLIVTFWMLLNK